MQFKLDYINLPDPSNKDKIRKLAYYSYGDASNPKKLLCMHGLSRNGLDFRLLAEAAAADYHVICPDMPGRGKSDKLENPTDYNYQTYVSDTNALLAALAITKTDWVGTSMGGIIAMMLGAARPGLIGKLVLNDIGNIIWAKGLKRIISYVGGETTFVNKELAMQYLKNTIAPFGIKSDEHWQYAFDASFIELADGSYELAYDPQISAGFRAAATSGQEIVDVDLTAFWQHIACPTLIIRGELSDIISRQTCEKMCENRPQNSFVEIPGVGHAPALMEDSQIQTIHNWLVL